MFIVIHINIHIIGINDMNTINTNTITYQSANKNFFLNIATIGLINGRKKHNKNNNIENFSVSTLTIVVLGPLL